MTPQYGPGPVIHGQDITNPNRYIVQHGNTPPQLLTPAEIAALPIHHQWFTGTINGLICTWWSREVAEQQATQRGTILGQIRAMTDGQVDVGYMIPVLCDINGEPLRAE